MGQAVSPTDLKAGSRKTVISCLYFWNCRYSNAPAPRLVRRVQVALLQVLACSQSRQSPGVHGMAEPPCFPSGAGDFRSVRASSISLSLGSATWPWPQRAALAGDPAAAVTLICTQLMKTEKKEKFSSSTIHMPSTASQMVPFLYLRCDDVPQGSSSGYLVSEHLNLLPSLLSPDFRYPVMEDPHSHREHQLHYLGCFTNLQAWNHQEILLQSPLAVSYGH